MRRKVFLLAALLALGVLFAADLGAGVWGVRAQPQQGSWAAPGSASLSIGGRPLDLRKADEARRGGENLERPGFGIPYLAMVDALLLVMFFFTGAAVVLPERLTAPASAIASLIVGILVLVAALVGIPVALGFTLAMVGLLLAFPFGTAAYLAGWGSFPVGAAAITLGALLSLKIIFCVCLLIANPRAIQNKRLVALTATSIVAGVVVAFLHGFPPGILATIFDGVAAIIVGIVAAIWAIVTVIIGILGLVGVVMAAAKTVT